MELAVLLAGSLKSKQSAFQGTAGEGYFVDTTSSSVTVTLPSPSVGDLISFVDYGGNSAVNPIIFTTSDNIEGGSADQGIQYNKGAVQLVFSSYKEVGFQLLHLEKDLKLSQHR